MLRGRSVIFGFRARALTSFVPRCSLPRAACPACPRLQHVGKGDSIPPTPEFTTQETEHKYQQGARREEQRLARKGKGVSETAQKIFDILCRK